MQQKHESSKAGLANSSPEKQNISLDKPRRGRPPKVAGQGPKAVTPSRKVGTTATETAAATADAATIAANRFESALQITNLIENSGVALGGEKAKMRETEKTNIAGSVDRYMAAKNIDDLPPGLALAIGLSQYYARVIQTEEALPKAVRFYIWSEGKIKNIFSRRKKFDARSHSRDDNERQDDASKEAGGAV